MPSPFANYLNTNDVLPSEGAQAVCNAIHKGMTILNDIDQRTYRIKQEMEMLRQELQTLAVRREVQERELNENVAILQTQSPIKRVDNDVLTYIFLSLLDVVNERNLELSPKHPAVVISHVCQRWRGLSLSTKPLWQRLYLEIPPYNSTSPTWYTWSRKLSKLALMAEVWISRSSGYPISVKVHEEPLTERPSLRHAPVPECKEFTQLLEKIRSSSTRWKDLVLKVKGPHWQFPNTMRLLALLPQDTPALAKVRIEGAFPWEACQPGSPQKQNIFNGSALRSLEIGPSTLTDNILHIPVIWSNLKHLSFDGYASSYTSPGLLFDARETLELFKECRNLVSCFLVLQKDVVIPTDRAPIMLRNLEHLALLLVAFQLPKGFATSLILPSLHTFHCTTTNGCSPRRDLESGLFEFFERFGSALKDVTFCYPSLIQTALHRCLRFLPNVTSLQLNNYQCGRVVYFAEGAGRRQVAASLDAETFMLLTPQFNVEGTAVTQSPLCPKLEVFRFSGDRVGPDKDMLVDFIVARRRMVDNQPSRLREVQAKSARFSITDLGQALRERGMDTTVSSLYGRCRFP